MTGREATALPQPVTLYPATIGPGRVTLMRLDAPGSVALVIVDTVQQVDLVPGRYLLNFHPFSSIRGDDLKQEVTVRADTTRLDLDEVIQAQPVLKPRNTHYIRPSYRTDSPGLKALFRPLDTIGGPFGFSPASRTGRAFDLAWSFLPGGATFTGRARLDALWGDAAYPELTVRVDGTDADSPLPVTGVLRLQVADRLPLMAVVPVFGGGTRISITHRGTDPIVETFPAAPALRSAIVALSEVDRKEAVPVLEWLTRQAGGGRTLFWDRVIIALLAIHCRMPMQEYADTFFEVQDAGVIKAWSRARHSDAAIGDTEAYVLSALKKAHQTGGPAFRQSYTLALALLEALRGTAQDRMVRKNAVTEMALWTTWGDRRVSDGPFTVYEDDGTLGPPYANIASWDALASGTVTDGGFRLHAAEDWAGYWPNSKEHGPETIPDALDPAHEIATLCAGLVGIPLTESDFGQGARDPGAAPGEGAFIISLAALGWTLYTDHRSSTGEAPTPAQLKAALDEHVGERTGETGKTEDIYGAVITMTILVGKTRMPE